MPLIDLADPANYEGETSLHTSLVDGKVVGLGRATHFRGWCNDADLLIDALEGAGLAKGDKVALVGAGYGWAGEQFRERGHGPVLCVEASPYFHHAGRKAEHARLPVLAHDHRTPEGRAAIGRADWCVSHMLFYLGDDEIAAFCDACRAVAPRVAHWVTPLMQGPPSQDSRLNWKTIDQWKSWVTPDFVVWEGQSTII